LASYYENNQKAQDLVTVRDWLLAEAFPATTLPMGANKYTPLEGNNIDMSGDSSDPQIDQIACCKTNEAAWPRKMNGIGVWYHSDYKDIPYQHVHEFYRKIKELSGNRGY